MSNKPIAWIDEETGCFVYSQYEYEDLDEHGKDGLIPLYIHPVKELDEDFDAICLENKRLQAEIDNLASIKYVNGVTISNLYAEIEALKAKAHEWYLIAMGKAQEK